jgi:hypothetical protein
MAGICRVLLSLIEAIQGKQPRCRNLLFHCSMKLLLDMVSNQREANPRGKPHISCRVYQSRQKKKERKTVRPSSRLTYRLATSLLVYQHASTVM